MRDIWKKDERYGKREMRDMKRYGWNMKERSFTTDDIEWASLG